MKKAVNPSGSVTFPVPVYGGRILLCLTRKAYKTAQKALDIKEEYESTDLATIRGLSSRHAELDQRSVYLIGYFDNTPPTRIHELAHTTF